MAAWAIPFGLAGALAHAILLDSRHDFRHAYRLWHAATVGVAAIGVPGAVALGTAGAWIACRRAGVRLGPVAGAAAPALAFGLAVGGLGNWWAQQFYGLPSTWWWAVRISPEHRVPGYENYATFQPAFLYQSLWEVALGFALIWAAGRFALSGERTFMLLRGRVRGRRLLGGVTARRPVAARPRHALRCARRHRRFRPRRGGHVSDQTRAQTAGSRPPQASPGRGFFR